MDRVTIYRMLESGQLPGFKVGGQWRFSRSEIDQWLQDQRLQGEASAGPDRADDAASDDDSHLLPLSCFSPIQDIYAEALGIMAVTLDPDGHPLIPSSGLNDFCSLIQSTEDGRQLCEGAWRRVCRLQQMGVSVLCPAGLRQQIAPVELDGKCLAVVVAGAYVMGDAELDGVSTRLDQTARAAGVDADALRTCIPTVQVMQGDDADRVARLLRRVAGAFSELSRQRVQFLGRLQRIADIARVS